MSAHPMVFLDPAKVALLSICIFGAAFMLWFLARLLADRTRTHANYVVRFKLGESQADMGQAEQLGDEVASMEARFDQRQSDRSGRLPVQGFRIEQRF